MRHLSGVWSASVALSLFLSWTTCADAQPPDAEVRAAALRQSVAQLTQIGRALHNFHDQHRVFPAAYQANAAGKPQLSWRVTLLPYFDPSLESLYNEFRMDEPWDSDHNKTLIAKIPDVYQCPLTPNVERGSTVYLAVTGDATVFPGGLGINARLIPDGLSNTIAIVEVDDSHAVPWTKPADWPFSPDQVPKGLGGHLVSDRFQALCIDGSVHGIRHATDRAVLRAFFTRNGDESVPGPKN